MPKSDADEELMNLQRLVSTNGVTAGMPTGSAVADDPNAISTFEMRKQAQRVAYGQFVAAAPIYIGNCLAFAPGNQVPLEHVIRYSLVEQNLVNRVADEDMAVLGKTYEDEAAFMAANPHLADQARKATLNGEAPPPPLARGGAGAEIDEARKASKTKPADRPDPTEAREAEVFEAREAVA